jgi:hypothetical protein
LVKCSFLKAIGIELDMKGTLYGKFVYTLTDRSM